MKRMLVVIGFIAILSYTFTTSAYAQVKWDIGGNMLLSISTGAGSAAGFHFGPMAEVHFNKQMAIGTEWNINTQPGTPIEWANYFKYYFASSNPKMKPYADGGFGLMFVSGGPYFGIRFGGGLGFQLAKGMWLGPDVQLGPVFATGTTIFYILIRGGFRYELPS